MPERFPPADSRAELPEELIELLPTNTSIVVALESLSSLDSLLELADLDSDEVRESMDEQLVGLLSAGYFDEERPMVWAAGEPTVNGPPAVTFVLPLSKGVDEASLPLQDFEGLASFRIQGGYIGVRDDHLSAGFSFDLEGMLGLGQAMGE